MKVDPVRLKALEILVRVQKGELLDPLLDQALAELRPDRGGSFLAELVRGTIQWRERYRHILKSFVPRQLPGDDTLLFLLFLSLHQLIALDGVPPYAAIHEAGQLCRLKVSPRKVAFVNGVLQVVKRAVAMEPGEEGRPGTAAERLERLRPLFRDLEDDPVSWLAAWHSYPVWLVRGWYRRFGRERTEAVCAAGNSSSKTCFHVLEPADPRQAGKELGAMGCPVEEAGSPRALEITGRRGRQELREILERFSFLIVQDPTVQEATTWLMAGCGEGPVAGRLVLDMCAAPGGKTARLAAAWGERNLILALDNRPARIALLRDTLQRTGQAEVRIVQADSLHPPLAEGSCAAVLLDGPCSGTGVLRRHPEGRWNLSRRAPGRNGRVLLGLAEKAADLLAPGGLLMYATCSLENQENEEVLAALLTGRSDLEPVPDSEGHWQRQWFPGEGGGDGFFAARLRKKTESAFSGKPDQTEE